MTTALPILDQLEENLPRLKDLLDSRPPTDNQPSRTVPGSQPPLNLDALNTQIEIHKWLTDWCQLVWEDQYATYPPPTDDLEMIQYLRIHDDDFQCHDAYPDYYAEGRYWSSKLAYLLGEPRPYRPRCRQCGGHILGIDQHGHVTSLYEHWAYCRCRDCGQDYPLHTIVNWLTQIQIVSLKEYANQTRTPLRTVQRKIRQAGIEPITYEHQTPKYWEDELRHAVNNHP